MKVLISYIYCTRGGVETAIKNRIKNISDKEVSFDLLFFWDYGGKDILQDLSCQIIIENDLTKIGELIVRNNYDAVITIDTYDMITVLNNINYSGQRILEVHTTYEEQLRYLKNLKEGDVSTILVPSNYQAKYIEQFLKVPVPIEIMPNSLDTSVFYERNMAGVKPDKKILLWIGRLDEHKNWRLFLEIAENMKKSTDNSYEYWVVGGMNSDELEKKKFFEMIEKKDLMAEVRWIPAVSYEKIANIYSYVAKSGGAYISTSKNESFGMTALEAMACGCPVILNDVGGLSELGAEGRGLVLEMTKSVDITDKMKKYLSNQKIMQEAINSAKEYSLTEYSDNVIAKRFVDLLTVGGVTNGVR